VNKIDIEQEVPHLRFDWSASEIEDILRMPFIDLLYRAQTVHRQFHPEKKVQLSSLLSIKTGGCKEDCKYCSQSAHHAKKTGLKYEPLMDVELVLKKALEAKQAGATRFCMGAAWREIKEGEDFDAVLDMIVGVKQLGMESCVTLGMLTKKQATRLSEAGLDYYNHNLDTSPEFYSEVVTTRTYDDRLDTLQEVRNAGISVCSGGIIGMGESLKDRARMLQVLANMQPHPESVPINSLVPVKGTPLEDLEQIEAVDFIRMIATTRIVLPGSDVRLSAGRHKLSREAQLLCLMAGANSIFYGEKLLTTDNTETDADLQLIQQAGLQAQTLS
jgi:biotin synthase